MSKATVCGLVIVVAGVLAGCGTPYQRANWHAQQGQWDKAVVYYMEAGKLEAGKRPKQEDVMEVIGKQIEFALAQASAMHYERGVELLSRNQTPAAAAEMKKALAYDPGNDQARELLDKLQEALKRYQAVSDG